jgi:hypothetical protein
MDAVAREFFLCRFASLTSDDATRRMPWFLLAYAVFRLGWCTMALGSVRNTPEERRLMRACVTYREAIGAALRNLGYDHIADSPNALRPAA